MSQTARYPLIGGIPTYPTLSAFPDSAQDGSLAVAQDSYVLYVYEEGGGWVPLSTPGGDVIGPVSSTSNAIVRWDGTGGSTLKDSPVLVGDTGLVSGVLDPVSAQDAATKNYVDAQIAVLNAFPADRQRWVNATVGLDTNTGTFLKPFKTTTAAEASITDNVGAVYQSPNGSLFTVSSDLVAGTSLFAIGAAAPNAAPNVLTKISGTGDATINYSAFSVVSQTGVNYTFTVSTASASAAKQYVINIGPGTYQLTGGSSKKPNIHWVGSGQDTSQGTNIQVGTGTGGLVIAPTSLDSCIFVNIALTQGGGGVIVNQTGYKTTTKSPTTSLQLRFYNSQIVFNSNPVTFNGTDHNANQLFFFNCRVSNTPVVRSCGLVGFFTYISSTTTITENASQPDTAITQACNTVAGSQTVTLVGGNTNLLIGGLKISGTGIIPGAVTSLAPPGATVLIDKPATLTQTGVTLTFSARKHSSCQLFLCRTSGIVIDKQSYCDFFDGTYNNSSFTLSDAGSYANVTPEVVRGNTTVGAGTYFNYVGTTPRGIRYVPSVSQNWDASTFTVSIASPAVFTKVAHGMAQGTSIMLSTTGALPTGLNATTVYYVYPVDADTFMVSTSALFSSLVTTTGSQSGVHSYSQIPDNLIIALDRLAAGRVRKAGDTMSGDLDITGSLSATASVETPLLTSTSTLTVRGFDGVAADESGGDTTIRGGDATQDFGTGVGGILVLRGGLDSTGLPTAIQLGSGLDGNNQSIFDIDYVEANGVLANAFLSPADSESDVLFGTQGGGPTSGDVSLLSGNPDAAGASGAVTVGSGNATGAVSGDVLIKSGTSDTARGSVTISGSIANIEPNLSVTTEGNGLRVKEGSNAKQGTATLVAGTVTVSNTSVTANSRIMLTTQVPGGVPGAVYISARTAATSFDITSTSVADTSTVAYEIFEPA